MLKIEKLSEKNLHDVIAAWFPEYADKIIPQKRFKGKSQTFIPDYYLETDTAAFAFEFNGPTHYTRTKTQIRDMYFVDYCMDNDIILIQIPYFIQATDRMLPFLLGTDLVEEFQLEGKVETTYKSGFHDKAIVFPSDFNEYGWKLFYSLYSEIVKRGIFSEGRDIYDTLVDAEDIYSDSNFLKLGTDWYENESKINFVKHYPT